MHACSRDKPWLCRRRSSELENFPPSARLGYEASSAELRQSKSSIELFPLTLCLSEYQLITFTSSVTATYKFVYNIVKLPFYKYIL